MRSFGVLPYPHSSIVIQDVVVSYQIRHRHLHRAYPPASLPFLIQVSPPRVLSSSVFFDQISPLDPYHVRTLFVTLSVFAHIPPP